MNRRTIRRRYAILGVLAQYGPSSATEVALRLRYQPGSLYPDLVAMEGERLVDSEWAENFGEMPRHRLYRVAKNDQNGS